MATAILHVRVDEKTKEKAAKTLTGMGISVSEAVRMLLGSVAVARRRPAKGKGRRSANALLEELGI